ncbi:MAG: zf-HC2 domain-containing protein [Polyangiaceae bacterium]
MSALKAPTDCVLYARALHAYVDGELSVDHTAEIEAHLVKCAECFEQVEQHRAVRLSLRRTSAAKAPSALHDRMAALIAAEASRPPSADRVSSVPRAPSREAKLIPLRHVMALAAAAGVVFAVGMSRMAKTTDEPGPSAGPRAGLLSMNFDDFVDDLVDMHASPLPPETTNPEELPRFDPFVGVPVRRPALPSFQPLNVRYDGARVQAVRGKRAALLLYTMAGNHRVTMYVFDAQTVPLQQTRLQQRVVRQQPVYVGNVRGYSFAATQRGGVGYALATDLDDDTSAKLVAAVQ